jgi:predicted Na+-dependent transporter
VSVNQAGIRYELRNSLIPADFTVGIAKLSGLLFIVASRLAMGISLAIPMIVQPLKNGRLVVLALLANFVLVPMLAYVIKAIIPLDQSLQIGLIVLSTAAGAPFLLGRFGRAGRHVVVHHRGSGN